jgi:hypothetical protein
MLMSALDDGWLAIPHETATATATHDLLAILVT